MSNLLPWLKKRRELFYGGDALQESIESFLKMIENGAKVHESDDAIIVSEEYGMSGCVRFWLLFDEFSRSVIRYIAKITEEYKKFEIYASTHDSRIRDLLLRMGYTQYLEDEDDFWLVKKGAKNGL